MKKVLIILLSLLLLISFTSCNADKSGEIASTFEKFVNAVSICNDATYLGNSGNITDDLKTVNSSDAKDLLASLNSKYKDLDKDTITLSNISGKITLASAVHTYSNISVSYSFPFNGKTESGVLTVNGTYKYETDGDIETYVYVMTVNGTEYKVEYEFNTKTDKYVSASVDGKSVELRLLNSDLSIRM